LSFLTIHHLLKCLHARFGAHRSTGHCQGRSLSLACVCHAASSGSGDLSFARWRVIARSPGGSVIFTQAKVRSKVRNRTHPALPEPRGRRHQSQREERRQTELIERRRSLSFHPPRPLRIGSARQLHLASSKRLSTYQ
jgi:hypothetical protein